MADTQRHIEHERLRVPEKEYFILFTARSGSSHLTDLLSSCEVGVPREWLNPAFLVDQANAFGARNFEDYFARMRSRFSRSGIFGQEMTIGFYEAFSREVCLEDHFKFASPAIFLFREDIVAQAVSLLFAERRNYFHKISEDELQLPHVPYESAKIATYIQTFTNEEKKLNALAVNHKMDVRFLSYEEHTQTPPYAVVEAIANHVGAKPKIENLYSRHKKIGGQLNEAYNERFRLENAVWLQNISAQREWLFDARRHKSLISQEGKIF